MYWSKLAKYTRKNNTLRCIGPNWPNIHEKTTLSDVLVQTGQIYTKKQYSQMYWSKLAKYTRKNNTLRCIGPNWQKNIFLYKRVGRKILKKLTQLSSRSHPRHLVGKRTAQKDITIDTTSDSQVNSNFPNKWSPASLTFNNYFYLFLYLIYVT